MSTDKTYSIKRKTIRLPEENDRDFGARAFGYAPDTGSYEESAIATRFETAIRNKAAQIVEDNAKPRDGDMITTRAILTVAGWLGVHVTRDDDGPTGP